MQYHFPDILTKCSASSAFCSDRALCSRYLVVDAAICSVLVAEEVKFRMHVPVGAWPFSMHFHCPMHLHCPIHPNLPIALGDDQTWKETRVGSSVLVILQNTRGGVGTLNGGTLYAYMCAARMQFGGAALPCVLHFQSFCFG